jgi:hypothetical protein
MEIKYPENLVILRKLSELPEYVTPVAACGRLK